MSNSTTSPTIAGKPARPDQPSSTVRLAGWSARHRGLVIGLWFAMVAGLVATSVALGGQRTEPASGGTGIVSESAEGRQIFAEAREPGAADDTDTTAAAATGLSERVALVIATDAGRIDTDDGRRAVASIVDELATATVPFEGAEIPLFAPSSSGPGVPVHDPFALAATDPGLAAAVIAADGTAVLVDARLEGAGPELEARTAALRTVLAAIRAEHPGLRILALDAQLLNGDLIDYASRTTGWLLTVTLPITFLILIVAFRALAAAVVPLVLGLSAVVGAMGLVGVYSRLVEPVGIFAAEFVVLIGLAVAIDYSLFVITRFRSERARDKDRLEAIGVASATAGRSVFFSGLAVIVSLGSLLLIDEPTVRSFAIGAVAVVLVAVIGSLTFLPATLSLLDRRIDWGRIPLPAAAGEGHGPIARVVRAAAERPVAFAGGTLAVLLVAIAPLTGIRLGSPGADLSVMPSEIEAVRAATLIAERWPQGSSLTLDVVVTDASAPATEAAIERVEAAATSVQGLGGPLTRLAAGDGSVVVISFPLSGGPNDPRNLEAVRAMRRDVVPAVFDGLPARAYVTGDAAAALDHTDFFVGELLVVVPCVLGVSFLLLLVAFRSVVVPLKAILLNLLAAGSAFGVLTLVFTDGWLSGITGIRPGVIDASDPVMMFAILFGLSMDYEVFILSRVREARDRGLPSGEAVAQGIAITSGTVTSAAAIMVCVFAGFFAIGIRNIQEFGLGLAVAVLIDATLIRCLLLPATMSLLGERNWWLPRFLAWIPRVNIAAESPEPAAVAGRSAAPGFAESRAEP